MQLHTILRALAFACLLIIYAQAIRAEQPGQGITLSVSREKLEKVFKEIEAQAKVSFIYSRETLSRAKPVTIEVKNEQLTRLLPVIFRSQPMTYSIDGAYVIIRAVGENTDTLPLLSSFKAKLVTEAGAPVAGATIHVKGTTTSITSDSNGEFILRNLTAGTVLLITGAELEPAELKIGNETFMTITLQPRMNELDQVLVMAYGQTTRRLNTGSIGKVSAAEIERQPVSNPLATLHGRVPGVVVTQSSGVPGAHVKIEIRGQNSLTQGSDPLFVIDGIPFGPNNSVINQINSVAGANSANNPGGLSPFNSINPGDIESIEILKDADATSIYGSRGANGVVLITTKKGKSGKTQVSVNAYSGFSKSTRIVPMLNTQEYVMMRKEAFANDGVAMTTTNAYDLLLWDTTRYTDMTKLSMGQTPSLSDLQLSLSGGNANSQFILRSAYHKETTVLPGDFYETRASVHFSFNHSSFNKRFKLQFSTGYSIDKNNLVPYSFPFVVALTPNLPELYDSLGQLNWVSKGRTFTNPLSYLYQDYTSNTSTLLSNASLLYEVMKGFTIKALFGYNLVTVDEQSLLPKKSSNPDFAPPGTNQMGRIKNISWSIEPQLEWQKKINGLRLSILAGATIQKQLSNGIYLYGTGYSSDILINDIRSAATVNGSNSASEYRYQAGFARINLNLNDKYLLNLTGRRDGSTRFGPENQYANFGAIGFGWIFSKEINQDFIPWLSFGKLRMSYGTTGNDQIGNYQFLDTWSPTTNGYQGSQALRPTRLYNPDYNWEVNKKAEAAVELGFFKDRFLVTAAYFLNRSSNQLINYNLPATTGFNSVIRNFPAVVENSGLELSGSLNIVRATSFNWIINGNISFPRNKLASFPDINSSSYANLLEVGRPLRLLKRIQYTGVNPQTGVYQFNDVNRDGLLTSADYLYLGSLVPDYTGGIGQHFSYKRLSLDMFFMFVKQLGRNYNFNVGSPAGDVVNRPTYVLERWQKPGDITDVQKFTANVSSAAYAAILYYQASDAVFSDASFWRLKNVSLTYELPVSWIGKIGASQCRVFVQGQNLLTFTSYKGSDPENQGSLSLPLMKTFTGGIQLTF